MSPRRSDEPSFTSYYGRPILKEPTWQATDIAGYLFLDGLAGASSILAAGADLTERPTLARRSKLAALTAIGVSAVALVHDLGKPARFYNMLRVAKPTSPMSVGSWLLAGYAPLAGLSAAVEVTGALPRLGRTAGPGRRGAGCRCRVLHLGSHRRHCRAGVAREPPAAPVRVRGIRRCCGRRFRDGGRARCAVRARSPRCVGGCVA